MRNISKAKRIEISRSSMTTHLNNRQWRMHREINAKTFKLFDYTMITDRLRTVSWSDNSYPICAVYLRFNGRTSLLTGMVVL